METARKLIVPITAVISGSAFGQVPDLLSSFDAGGRAFGSGGSFYVTASETLSSTNNPAGLGFVNERIGGVAARSFPKTRTFVNGPLNNLQLDTQDEERGDLRLAHLGFAKPIGGNRGAIGVAWTTGGWMNDDRLGQNLPGGIASYFDSVRIRTDFLNFSWGRANGDQSMSLGIGIVVGINSVFNRQFISFSDPEADPVSARSDNQSYGLGIQAGVILVPRNNPNMSFGLTARSPIKMVDDKEALSLYDQIPGRVALGVAIRQEGYRGGRDYVIFGGEVEHFFNPGSSDRVERENHTGGRVGFEYNYTRDSFTVPIRVGFAANSAGGDGFDDRTSLTFGFGYRPLGQKWMIDFGFGSSSSGGKDTAIMLSVKF